MLCFLSLKWSVGKKNQINKKKIVTHTSILEVLLGDT